MIEFLPLSQPYFERIGALFLQEKGDIRAHQLPANLPWAFLDYPTTFRGEPIFEVAVEDDRVLGCMGAIPQRLLNAGNEIESSFFVDWLVDSTQRRRKIGSRVLLRAADRYPVCVHMGSTPSGYATCATLGAQDFGRTVTARRVLRPWNWSKGASRTDLASRLGWSAMRSARQLTAPRITSNLTVTPVPVDSIDADLRQRSRQLSHTHLTTERNSQRWTWLMDSPLYSGVSAAVREGDSIRGYVLLIAGYRSQRLVGSVADICVADINDAAPVLQAGLAYLAQRDIDGITFTVSEEVGTPVANALGFEIQSNPRMGTWLHDGYDFIRERQSFVTMAENISVAAGIDKPVRRPKIMWHSTS